MACVLRNSLSPHSQRRDGQKQNWFAFPNLFKMSNTPWDLTRKSTRAAALRRVDLLTSGEDRDIYGFKVSVEGVNGPSTHVDDGSFWDLPDDPVTTTNTTTTTPNASKGNTKVKETIETGEHTIRDHGATGDEPSGNRQKTVRFASSFESGPKRTSTPTRKNITQNSRTSSKLNKPSSSGTTSKGTRVGIVARRVELAGGHIERVEGEGRRRKTVTATGARESTTSTAIHRDCSGNKQTTTGQQCSDPNSVIAKLTKGGDDKDMLQRQLIEAVLFGDARYKRSLC